MKLTKAQQKQYAKKLIQSLTRTVEGLEEEYKNPTNSKWCFEVLIKFIQDELI